MHHVHITGASGSGTTTLGRSLAEALCWTHFDSDDFFWLKTDPPFQEKREAALRVEMLAADLAKAPSWVLSGSIMGWTGLVEPDFDLIVFLDLPMALRMKWLKAREIERYGAEALAPGGDRHQESEEFLAWAAAYDDGETVGRNRMAHESWLADRTYPITCPILRLDSTFGVQENVGSVCAAMERPIDCS